VVAVADTAVVAAAMVVAAVATAGLEVAATPGSLDAEVAAGSGAASGSGVAGAAAAGSMTSGMVMLSGSVTSRPPAANPGAGAACAKSRDLMIATAMIYAERRGEGGPKREDQRGRLPPEAVAPIGGSNAFTSSLILGYALSRVGVGIESYVQTRVNPKPIRGPLARREMSDHRDSAHLE